MTIPKSLEAANYEIISNIGLKTELFEQAKAFTAKYGLVLFICHDSLDALTDSILISKNFAPVSGMTFIGIPLRYCGLGLKPVRKLVMELPVGRLPIFFTAVNTTKQATVLSIFRHWGELGCKLRANGGMIVNKDDFTITLGEDQDVLVDWEVDTTHPERAGRYKRCGKCNSLDNLQLCSSCRGIHYCSAQCQKDDWQEHKVECPKLAQLCAPGVQWYD